jgi:hypothetical protein
MRGCSTIKELLSAKITKDTNIAYRAPQSQRPLLPLSGFGQFQTPCIYTAAIHLRNPGRHKKQLCSGLTGAAFQKSLSGRTITVF